MKLKQIEQPARNRYQALMAMLVIVCAFLGTTQAETVTRNQPPYIPYDLTALGYRVINHRPWVCWAGGDPDGDTVTYDLAIGDQPNPTAVVWTGQNTCTDFLGNLVDGEFYYWRVRGYDGIEYSSWSTNQSFGMNAAPSSPTISYPNSGECLAGVSTVTLTWTVSTNDDPTDPDDPIDYTLYMSTDGGGNWNGVAYTTNTGYYEWQTYGITNTMCMFRVVAGDGYETTMDSSDAFFIIDSTRPESYCFCTGDYANSSPIPISYAGTDSGCGIYRVYLWYQFESGAWTNSGLYATEPTGTIMFNPATGQGLYRFYTIATDLAGNQELAPTEAEDWIIYDTTRPNSSGTSPEYANVTPISVNFVSNDQLSGVATTWLWYRYGLGSWSNTGLSLTGESGTFQFAASFGDGTYRFYTISYDRAGNIETKFEADTTTVLDRLAPVSVITPVPAAYSNTSTVIIRFQASDELSGMAQTWLWHKVGTGGTWQQTALNPESGTQGSFNYTFSSGQNRYYFATRSSDNAGNYEAEPSGSGDASIVFDTTSPASSATCSAYDNTSPISVYFNASDSLSGLLETNLFYKYTSGGAWIPSGLPAQAGTTGIFFFVPQNQGTYYFASVARDNANNVEASPVGNGDCSCIYDTTTPTSIASCSQYSTGSAISVDFTATDATSGINLVQLWYRLATGSWTNSGLTLSGTTGTFQFSSSQQGLHYFATVAIDNAGNSEDAPAGFGDCSTIYDNVIPVSSADSDPYATANPVAISWTAEDATSGINTVTLWVKYQTGTWQVSGLPAQSGTSGLFNYTAASQGQYYFATIATDVAGNSEPEPTGDGDCSCFYDAVTPQAILSALPSTVFLDVIDLEYTVSDPAPSSGLEDVKIYYRKDAGNWLLGPIDLPPDGHVNFDFTLYGGEGFYEFEAVASDMAGNTETRTGLPETFTLKRQARLISIYLTPDHSAIHPGGNLQVTVALDSSVIDPSYLCYISIYVEYDPLFFEVPTLTDLIPVQGDGSAWDLEGIDPYWDADGVDTDAVQFVKQGDVGILVAGDPTDAALLTFQVKCTAPVLQPRATTPIGLRYDWLSLAECGGAELLGAYPSITLTSGPNSAPTAPSLSQSGPSWGGWTSNPPELRATSIDSDNDAYRAYFSIDAGPFVQGSLATSGQISSYVPSQLSDGDHTWAAYSADACDESTIVEANGGNIAFRIDSINPPAPLSLTIIPSSWTSSDAFTVTWSNPQDLSGIGGAFYKIGSPPSGPSDGILVLGDEISSLTNLQVATQGISPIYVWLQDNAGNADYLTAQSVEAYLDSTTPTVEITHPVPDSCTNTTTVQISGEASDLHSGLTSVAISVDNGATWNSVSGTTTWDYAWIPAGEGAYLITARAADLVGNLGYSAPLTITIDWTPPETTITSPPDEYCTNSSDLEFTGTADDEGCGIAAVSLSFDGGTTFIPVQGTEQWHYLVEDVPEGDYVVMAKALDAADNEDSTPATINLKIDRQPPSITILSPEEDDCLAGNLITVSGTATDQHCGVQTVLVSLDLGDTWTEAEGTQSWSASIDVEDGPLTVWVKAVDHAANESDPEAVSIRVDNAPPLIMFGGYWSTYLTESLGGSLTILLLTTAPDVDAVQLLFGGEPTGVFLGDSGTNGDWTPNDGLYTLAIDPLSSGVPAGVYNFSIEVTDLCGNRSVWPELEVR